MRCHYRGADSAVGRDDDGPVADAEMFGAGGGPFGKGEDRRVEAEGFELRGCVRDDVFYGGTAFSECEGGVGGPLLTSIALHRFNLGKTVA